MGHTAVVLDINPPFDTYLLEYKVTERMVPLSPNTAYTSLLPLDDEVSWRALITIFSVICAVFSWCSDGFPAQ